MTVVGDAPWIDDEAAFDEVLAELVTCDRVGIDTEFHRERTYFPECALVQVCWGDAGERRALIDPLALDMRKLAPVLQGRTLVMHAAGQDLEVFQHSVGTMPDDLFDTQVAASFLGMSSIGLAPLLNRELGVNLPKADRLTDWTVRPLSDSAKAYAESDVVHLFELHDRMRADLEQRGRLDWVADECGSMIERAVDRPPPEQAWWRVKEARRLRGRAAAVAQAVAAWRERQAMEDDRPLRSVLPDLALASIAQRPPKSADGLGSIRGVRDRGLAKRHRGAIMEAVAEGQALDLDDVVMPESKPVPSELRAAIPLLMSWVSARARTLELDPAVLATRADLEAFLRSDDDARLRRGWRRDAIAAELDDLLDGKAALTFARGEGLVLVPEKAGG